MSVASNYDLREGERVILTLSDNQRPRFGWGKIPRETEPWREGIVRQLLGNGRVIIDFKDHQGWLGMTSEIQRYPPEDDRYQVYENNSAAGEENREEAIHSPSRQQDESQRCPLERISACLRKVFSGTSRPSRTTSVKADDRTPLMST